MNFLIDTNICIYIMNKKPPEVISRFKSKDVGQIGISTITVSELNYGVSKSKSKMQNHIRLEEFLAPLKFFPMIRMHQIIMEKYVAS